LSEKGRLCVYPASLQVYGIECKFTISELQCMAHPTGDDRAKNTKGCWYSYLQQEWRG